MQNLTYLSTRQVLPDLARFSKYLRVKYNLTTANKWISFGCSYAGTLSAWLRLKYPDLIYAAVSYSAPLLSVVDFSQYAVSVNRSFTRYSPECSQIFHDTFKAAMNLTKTTKGRQYLAQLFKLNIYIFKFSIQHYVVKRVCLTDKF